MPSRQNAQARGEVVSRMAGSARSKWVLAPSRSPRGPQHAGEVVDVANQQLTHSGDSRLARHIGKAVLREEARGGQLAKERKDSPRRIDAAVAAVMAVHRAAELAGAREPTIYIRAHYDPGERTPRGRSLGHASLGAWPAGRWVSPGSR